MALVTSAAASLKNTWGFSPQSIPGLALWLDAADTSSITGTSTVTAWRDKSGNGNNATATGSPALTQNAINGVQAISTAVGTYFLGPVSISGSTLTCFAVATTNVTMPNVRNPRRSQRLVSLANGEFRDYASNGVIPLFNQDNTNTISIYKYSDGAIIPSNPIQTNTPFLAVTHFDGTTASLWFNGSAGTVPTNAYNISFNITKYGIGEQANPVNGENWSGFFGEIILFSTALTTPQRQQVEGYLAAKWGLKANLPATHPYAAIASVPFNRPFYPTDIGGCLLWLDAADQSSIVGTSPVTSWVDKSGTGNTMTITTGNVTYTTNPPAVVFPNAQVSCRSALSTNVITAGSSGFFMVLQNTAMNATSINMAFTCVNILEGGLYATSMRFQDASDPKKLRVSTTGDIGSNYYVNGTLGVPGGVGGNIITVPAGSNVIDTIFNLGGTTQFALSIGNYVDAALVNRFFIGNIQEVIVYTGPITTAQRQQVEQYLTWKWGLPTANLPTSHPGKLLPAFGTPFTPKSLTGLQLWLDAADSSTITGTSTVTAWADKSGNGNNGTATGTPTLSTAGGFGSSRPNTINLDGSSWFLGSVAISTTTLTAFVVTSELLGSATNDARIISLATPGQLDYSAVSYCVPFFQNSGTNNVSSIRKMGATYLGVTYSNVGTSTPLIGTCVYDGASNYLYKNASLGRPAVAVSGTFGITTYGIGNYASLAGNEPFKGNIGEVILFNTALSTSQRQQVEGYLAWKWGLQSSLPSTHAYAKFSP